MDCHCTSVGALTRRRGRGEKGQESTKGGKLDKILLSNRCQLARKKKIIVIKGGGRVSC